MSNIKLVHSGGNSVSITTPTSNPASNRTLRVPGNADGTILTSKFGPSFAARNNSAQTITNGTTATMQFDIEVAPAKMDFHPQVLALSIYDMR